MKELLTAIRTQLRTSLEYVRDSDVFITPDTAFLPEAARKPCVGIKDGPVRTEERAGGYVERTMTVRIAVFVEIFKHEASIIGDESTEKKGLLDVCDDIDAALDENLLSIAGMQSALLATEEESILFAEDDKGRSLLQRKILNFQYVKEEQRP